MYGNRVYCASVLVDKVRTVFKQPRAAVVTEIFVCCVMPKRSSFNAHARSVRALVAFRALRHHLPIHRVRRRNTFAWRVVYHAVCRGVPVVCVAHLVAVEVGVRVVIHATVTAYVAFLSALALHNRTTQAQFPVALRIEVEHIAELHSVGHHVEIAVSVT